MLVVMTIGISLGYLFGANLLQSVIIGNYAEIARLLGNDISDLLDKEIRLVDEYAGTPLWKEQLSGINSQRASATSSTIRQTLLERDIELKSLVKNDRDIIKISVADIFGGLVATSNKAENFYQAGQEWWPEAFANGEGKIFVGDAVFSDSANAWVIPLAVPIKDRAGNLIGICKEEISTERFFAQLGAFRTGITARAILLGDQGKFVYSPEIKPMSKKLASDRDLQRLLKSERKYEIIYNPSLHAGKTFVVFADIKLPRLSGDKVVRRIFIDYAARKVFAPLKQLISYLIILTAILIIIMVPVGYIFGGIFTRPINKLHESTEQIAKGDFDYPIEINTGDEIEQFAVSFKEMVQQIKNKQRELEGLARSLEEKVKERTRELSEANEKLAEALNVKSHFTAMVSHELRTPLAAIKEGISVVLDEITGCVNDGQRECLDIAKKNVDRLSRLINEVLDFQKLESGKMIFNMQENDINEVAKEVRAAMLALAEEKNLDFILLLDEHLPKINFDKDKITQVLMNIVNNAIKFTDKGTITIITRQGDNFIQVTVQDTGTGIRDDDLSKLFREFFQLETGSQKRAEGTGLGLAISLEIIEAHKGKIWPESVFGQGTSIHFLLPIKERRI
jgi:signal transduction histidine kinase